jgi:pimeloyl-ACP methyl ester carboxylesterase
VRPVLLFTLTAVLLPLLLSEFGDWCPWLAVRIVRWSARHLGDPSACARYGEEWLANLNEVPGKLSRLLAAFGYLACVPQMRWALRRSRRAAGNDGSSPVAPLEAVPPYQARTRSDRIVRAEDGRRLSAHVFGDPDGQPVFLLHGTPGSRLGPRPRSAVLHRLGIQLISFDRPGYGGSDRQPGRRVADVAADVRSIADAFGLDRFAVVGRSGGGPHALACATLLPERTTRAAVLAGLAPQGAGGLDWFDGVAQVGDRDFTAAANVGDNLFARLQDELADLDRRKISDGGIRSMLIETYAEALRESAYGWIDDALAFCSPWGFDLASVAAPVLLWHGKGAPFTPAGHASWLADQIPSAVVMCPADSSQFGALDILPDVLQWLTAEPRRS